MRAESPIFQTESTGGLRLCAQVAATPSASQTDATGSGDSFLHRLDACVLIDGAVFSISRAGESRGEVAEWSKALPC